MPARVEPLGPQWVDPALIWIRAASNTPDWLCATATPGAHFPGLGNNFGWPVEPTSAAGQPLCWPAGNPVWSSNAGARDCDNPEERTLCSGSTCVGSIWISCRTKSEALQPRKQNHSEEKPRSKNRRRKNNSQQEFNEENPAEENTLSNRHLSHNFISPLAPGPPPSIIRARSPGRRILIGMLMQS